MEKGTLVKSAITSGVDRIGIVIDGPRAAATSNGDRYKVCWQDHPVFKVISVIPCVEWKHQDHLEVISLPKRDGQG